MQLTMQSTYLNAGNSQLKNRDMPVIAGNNLHCGDSGKLLVDGFEKMVFLFRTCFLLKIKQSACLSTFDMYCYGIVMLLAEAMTICESVRLRLLDVSGVTSKFD